MRAACVGLIAVLVGEPAHAFELAELLTDHLSGSDLVVVQDPARPDAPGVLAATLVHADLSAVLSVVQNPRAYRDALPSLVRADVVATRGQKSGGAAPDLQVAWELEVPLFNLEGRMWVRPRPDGAELILHQGDFSPGRFVFRAVAATSGTVLSLEGSANVREASWVLRKMTSRSQVAGPAIAAIATYVLLKAAAAMAEHPSDPAARRPATGSAPAPERLDPAPALLASLDPLRGRGIVVTVGRGVGPPSAAAAAALPWAAAAVMRTLAQPASWAAFPGWARVKPLGPGRAAVEVNVPFADLDATWEVRSHDPLRVVAVEGDIRGAAFAWRVRPLTDQSCLATIGVQPRLDAAGWVIRRFIRAEPLLEPALAMALAYADIDGTRAHLRRR